MQYLEQTIAALESEVNASSTGSVETVGTSRAAQEIPPVPRQEQIHRYLGQVANEIPRSTSAELARPWGWLVSRLLSTPSQLPTSVMGVEQSKYATESVERNWVRSSSIDLKAVPTYVAQVLIGVYVDKILPQYPFFSASQILNHYAQAYTHTSSPTEEPADVVSTFVTAIVMAISTMTSTSSNIEKPMAFADALFHFAISLYDKLPPNSMEVLQSTMLVCQFANFRPCTANVWAAKDTAMRIAISLGLHRDPQSGWHSFDEETIRLRAQVFWVVSEDQPRSQRSSPEF